MPSINMIASRREEKRRFQKYTQKLVYAIIGEVGIVVLLASFMAVKLVQVRGQISDLNGQIATLQPKVEQIKKLEAQTALLKPKVGTLNEARNNTLYWYTAMQTVVASLPSETWLTSLATSGDPTPIKPAAGATGPAAAPTSSAGLSFNGVATSPDEIGLAMMRMNQFQNINNVTLDVVNVSAASAKGPQTLTFSMAVALKPNVTGDMPAPNFQTTPPPALPTIVVPTPAPIRQANAAPVPVSTIAGGNTHVEKS